MTPGRRALAAWRPTVGAALCLVAFAWAAPANAQTPAYEPGELIVRYEEDASAAERSAIRRSEGAKLIQRLPLAGLELVRVQRGDSVREAEAEFEDHRQVAYAEPNAVIEIHRTPNDPAFTTFQWGLDNLGKPINGMSTKPDADIDAPEAWDLATDAGGVVVAVIDSGIDITHPDLRENIWHNPGESGGGKEDNGKDDDGNGFVDDATGWSFAERDNTPTDKKGHGTHVAGTIGAVGDNGLGGAGVAWRVQLMPVKVLGDDGRGSTADVIAGFAYAVANGAQVINASIGGSTYSQAMKDVIQSAKDRALFVISAGNEGRDNDQNPSYPCNYSSPNLICVAATGPTDLLAPFSNYGARSVEIAAPGVNVYSTLPGGLYGFKSGTSMAAPHVAGAAALIYVFQPGIDPPTARATILTLHDKLPGLEGKVLTGGRLGLPHAPPPVEEPKPEPKKPEPKKPEPAPKDPPPPVEQPRDPPADHPDYPSPAQPGAPDPRVQLLVPIGSGRITPGGEIRVIDGFLGNVNLLFIREVIVSVERRGGGRCWYLTEVGMLEHECSDVLYVSAAGTNSWEYALSAAQVRGLRRGAYTIRVRIITTGGESLLVGEKRFRLDGKRAKRR